jgi:hypothetical protein
MADPRGSTLALSELKARGVHISIFDFGTFTEPIARIPRGHLEN